MMNTKAWRNAQIAICDMYDDLAEEFKRTYGVDWMDADVEPGRESTPHAVLRYLSCCKTYMLVGPGGYIEERP